MVAIKNIIILAASASAAVIGKRSFSQLQTDLQTVDKDVNQLTSDANSWSGSIFTAGSIDSDANQLESDLQTAASDASSNGALTADQAETLIAYIKSPLQGDIANAMTALKNQASNIDNDGLESTVESALQKIKSEADTYAANLSANMPSAQQSDLASAFAPIDSELQAAINEFSS